MTMEQGWRSGFEKHEKIDWAKPEEGRDGGG